MEKQSITIYDVAKKAGVSMATVSRVVNGNPNVKPATRKKVMEVIGELDYRPDGVARALLPSGLGFILYRAKCIYQVHCVLKYLVL